MVPFSLDQSAISEIKKIAIGSRCDDPVAVLSRWTGPMTASQDLYDALKSGDGKAFSDVAMQGFNQLPKISTWALTVFVYERKELTAADILPVGEIEFELPALYRERLQDARLFYRDGAFVLENQEGKVIDPPF